MQSYAIKEVEPWRVPVSLGTLEREIASNSPRVFLPRVADALIMAAVKDG